MDNRNPRLFPNDIENLQSNEEAEDLEEQKRRQEELEHLLTDGIQAFKYDDSTVNSSTNVSLASDIDVPAVNKSIDNKINFNYNKSEIQSPQGVENYRELSTNEQLQVLYDVRLREINKLQEEYNQFKLDMGKEMNILKNKVILGEAEMRQLQLSLSNAQNLLAEKAGEIIGLQKNLSAKTEEITNLQKDIEQFEIEICTYKATVNELHLKQSDNNPFSIGARNFKSDELQKANQAQLAKLESLLETQIKKSESLEREKLVLQQDLKNVMENKDDIESRSNQIIKTLQNSQQQSINLFNINESLKNENEHLRERIKQLDANLTCNESFKKKSMDNETLLVHLEKLRRMLGDKDMELTALQNKLNCYEADSMELFEYRQLIMSVYSNKIQTCEDSKHMETFIIMQHELKNSQKLIGEKDEEITRLHRIIKELEEKIEEMLQQTRNDIKNLSHKYSIPQLEMMSQDLKIAEEKIQELEMQLKQNEEIRLKLQSTNEEEINKHRNENNNLKESLEVVGKDLKKAQDEIDKLQQCLNSVKESEIELKKRLEEIQSSKTESNSSSILENDKSLYRKYTETQEELLQLKASLKELTNAKILVEVEKINLETKLKESHHDFVEISNEVTKMHKERDSLLKELQILQKSYSHKPQEIQQTNELMILKQKSAEDLQKLLEEEIMKQELKRDHLQSEHTKHILEIEARYQKALDDSCQMYNTVIEQMKQLEEHYRKQLCLVLAECGNKIILIEEENENLKKHINELLIEYENYKKLSMEKYEEIVNKSKRDCELLDNKWKRLMDYYTTSYVKIEKKCHDKMNGITKKINLYKSQMEVVELAFDQKIKEFQKNHQTKN